MKQPITGFHKDEEDDWVADLACGHTQHVRRESKLGSLSNCKECDRQQNES